MWIQAPAKADADRDESYDLLNPLTLARLAFNGLWGQAICQTGSTPLNNTRQRLAPDDRAGLLIQGGESEGALRSARVHVAISDRKRAEVQRVAAYFP